MRKQIITNATPEKGRPEDNWLDLEHITQVEVSSEDAEHPVESALIPGSGLGWKAAVAGEQTIRLLFDEPRKISRIRLQFNEQQGGERTQEFVLRWSPSDDRNYREIVRQQYNFSPPAVTAEVEDYFVNLDGVAALDLKIIPDISGGQTCASLAQFRVA